MNVPEGQFLLGSRCCPEAVNVSTHGSAVAPTSCRDGARMDWSGLEWVRLTVGGAPQDSEHAPQPAPLPTEKTSLQVDD